MKAASLVGAKEISLVPAQKMQKSEKVEAGPECVLCEFAMKELDSILEDNATKVCIGDMHPSGFGRVVFLVVCGVDDDGDDDVLVLWSRCQTHRDYK